MTGLSGNRLSFCPLRFRIASPKFFTDRGAAEVNRIFWGGDPKEICLLSSRPVIICLMLNKSALSLVETELQNM